MRIFTFKTLVVGLLALAPVAVDHARAESKAETYRLTMPAIRATLTAYADLVQLLASNPDLAAKYKAARKALPDTNGRDTMGLTAGKLLPSEPRVAAIFKNAGTSPSTTTTTFETLLGVMFGEAMLQSTPGGDESKLPPFVAENLAFYREHKTEIESVFKSFSAKASAFGKVNLDDEEEEQR